MEYFWLEADPRYRHYPFIQGLFEILPIDHAKKANSAEIKDLYVVYTPPNSQNQYTDILARQLFLVNDIVKDVLCAYSPDIIIKDFCLLDNKNMISELYHLMLMDEYDCLHEDSVHNPDKSSFKKVVLKKNALNGQRVFRIAKVNTGMVIVSLDVAESLLRRRITGIRIVPVALK